MTARPAGTLRILTEATLVSIVFAALLGFSTYLLYQKSLLALENEIKFGLLSNVRAAATGVNGDIHQTFDATTSPEDPDYQRTGNALELIRQHSQDVRYIYTTIMMDGKVRFVVNPSPQNDMDKDGQPDAPPARMAEYTDAPPDLVRILSDFQPVVTAEPYRDEWGSFISAYAPIVRADGKPVGVLAMDLEMSSFYRRLMPIHDLFGKALFVIAFLSLSTGLLVYGLRTKGARQLLGMIEWREMAGALQTHFRENRVQQLQDRAVPWCLLFGGASPAALPPTTDDHLASSTTGEMHRLGTWLSDNRDGLIPTPDSRIGHKLPAECVVYGEMNVWSAFWSETMALWHDCTRAPLAAEFVMVDELLAEWRLACRISVLPGETGLAGQMPAGDFWGRFLEWQAHASALGVSVHDICQGRMELRFILAKFPMSAERSAA